MSAGAGGRGRGEVVEVRRLKRGEGVVGRGGVGVAARTIWPVSRARVLDKTRRTGDVKPHVNREGPLAVSLCLSAGHSACMSV